MPFSVFSFDFFKWRIDCHLLTNWSSNRVKKIGDDFWQTRLISVFLTSLALFGFPGNYLRGRGVFQPLFSTGSPGAPPLPSATIYAEFQKTAASSLNAPRGSPRRANPTAAITVAACAGAIPKLFQSLRSGLRARRPANWKRSVHVSTWAFQFAGQRCH